jgi:hypothetical protein
MTSRPMLVRGQNKYRRLELLAAPTANVSPVIGGTHTQIVNCICASLIPKK